MITGAGSAFCSGADLVTRFAADGDATTDTFRPGVRGDARRDRRPPGARDRRDQRSGDRRRDAARGRVRRARRRARCAPRDSRRQARHPPECRATSGGSRSSSGRARPATSCSRGAPSTPRRRSTSDSCSTSSTTRLAAALALAGEIAASAPLTVRGHKRALNLIAEAQWLGDDARAEIAALEAARVREQRPARRHGRVRGEAHPRLPRELGREESVDGRGSRRPAPAGAALRARRTRHARRLARVSPRHAVAQVRRSRRRGPQEPTGGHLQAVAARSGAAHGRGRAELVPPGAAARGRCPAHLVRPGDRRQRARPARRRRLGSRPRGMARRV